MTDQVQVEKVVRDGDKVAVLYSPGYGAGWSSWCHEDIPVEFAVFDRLLVEAVERRANSDEVATLLKEKFGQAPYMGGWSQVEIGWLPIGTKFRIDEYDGFESIITLDQLSFTA